MAYLKLFITIYTRLEEVPKFLFQEIIRFIQYFLIRGISGRFRCNLREIHIRSKYIQSENANRDIKEQSATKSSKEGNYHTSGAQHRVHSTNFTRALAQAVDCTRSGAN